LKYIFLGVCPWPFLVFICLRDTYSLKFAGLKTGLFVKYTLYMNHADAYHQASFTRDRMLFLKNAQTIQ